MIRNEEKITKELCVGKTLVFLPKNKEESAFIQRNLLDMGCSWARKDGGSMAEIVPGVGYGAEGICLQLGKMILFGGGDGAGYLLCSSDQFSENYTSDRLLLQSLFNVVSALTQKVDAIYAEVMPQKLDKPVLDKKPPQP